MRALRRAATWPLACVRAAGCVRHRGLCGSNRWLQLPALCSYLEHRYCTLTIVHKRAARRANSVAPSKSGCDGFFRIFAFAPGSASTGRMEPKHPHGSSRALLVHIPLATLRESLFVSARASARERAQRVPTRAFKDARDSHGPRSLVRSSPAPRSTPGVYPGAPRAASEKAAPWTRSL